MTDTFPKTGRVTEVCKEWLVREDNALAHHLQLKEIKDHYKGNRYRNQIVREDFPTALHEQIKEQENAARQAVLHQQFINEQEKADCILAQQLADKIQHSGNTDDRNECPSTSNLPYLGPKRNPVESNNHSNMTPLLTDFSKSMEMSRSNHLNYVSLDLPHIEKLPTPNVQKIYKYSKVISKNQPIMSSPSSSSSHDRVYLQSHTPEKKVTYSNIHPIESNIPQVRNITHMKSLEIQDPNLTDIRKSPHKNSATEDITQYEEYDRTENKLYQIASSSNIKKLHKSTENPYKKLSLESYEHLMGIESQKLPLSANEVFLTSEGIRNLEELGASPEEIQEIDGRIAQQARDEEYARRLQQMERKNLTFEEQDRLVAMEAQDKELARMLQERERAKAKRSKERARLRKQYKMNTEEGDNRELKTIDSTEASYYNASNDSNLSPINCSTMEDKLELGITELSVTGGHLHDYSLNEHYSSPVDAIKYQNESTSVLDQQQGVSSKKKNPFYKHETAISEVRQSENISAKPVHRTVENIATVIDPTYEYSDLESQSRAVTAEPLPDFLDQNVSPVPPYMPIQGTRRPLINNKKKAPKDKCIQQ